MSKIDEVRGSRGADSVVARRNSYAPSVVSSRSRLAGRRGLSDKITVNKQLFTDDFLTPIRNCLNKITIQDPVVAHRICAIIPTQCPFAREVKLLGHTVVRIPPLCKLNPLYNEVVALRFRALCYLADECGEDVSSYC